MTVARGFAITLASGAGGGLLGAVVGTLIGYATPDYYRMVFRVPPEVVFRPTQLGFGLGLTQGLAAGLVVGLVIVLAVAWTSTRSRN
jgi:hypothetical protein